MSARSEYRDSESRWVATMLLEQPQPTAVPRKSRRITAAGCAQVAVYAAVLVLIFKGLI